MSWNIVRKGAPDPASSQKPDRLGIPRVWCPDMLNTSPHLMEQNTPNLGTKSRTPYATFPEVKHWYTIIIVNVGSDTQTKRTAADDTQSIRSVGKLLNFMDNLARLARYRIAIVWPDISKRPWGVHSRYGALIRRETMDCYPWRYPARGLQPNQTP